MRSFEDLNAWKKSHQLILGVYAITRYMPADETYGLRSQLRRAAVSVSANIAEGAGRLSNKDYRRFISNALGSASEVQCLLRVAEDLGMVADTAALREQVLEVKRLLRGLERHLASST